MSGTSVAAESLQICRECKQTSNQHSCAAELLSVEMHYCGVQIHWFVEFIFGLLH